MNSPKYIIQKLILEMEIEDADQPEALQKSEEFKQLFLENLLSYLEDALKKYDRYPENIQIDKLDIILDDISMDNTSTVQEIFEKKIILALDQLGLSSKSTMEVKGITAMDEKKTPSNSSITEKGFNTNKHSNESTKVSTHKERVEDRPVSESNKELTFEEKFAARLASEPHKVLTPDEIAENRLASESNKILAKEKEDDVSRFASQYSENVSVVSMLEKHVDALIFYLRHGYLPWNVTLKDFSDPENILKEVLEENPSYFKLQLRKLSDSEHAMKRFVLQFPEVLIQKTLSLLSQEVFLELESLCTNIEEISRLITRMVDSNLNQLSQEVFLQLEALFTAKKESIGSTARTGKSILIEAALKHALKGENLPEIKEVILIEAARIASKEILPSQDTAQLDSQEDFNFRRELSTSEDLELLQKEGVYINNAGLILTWPYLQMFFKELYAYTEAGLADKEKAMHLLHYLCFGTEEEWECALFLNKIICGWDLETPLGEKITLSDPEKEECDQLIEAIVRNWPALKNTSVEGFREAFLQREGIISKVNDNWLLRIERKGYDVMLEQLEWGINTIKLSWNDYTIFVEW